jgi:hypothetical protein
VPSDFGISALVADAYADFTHGLDVLSDGGQRDARDRAVRRRPEDADVRSINIPGWDDVVHAIPRPRATRDEKDAHYAAKRAGQASPLNPDLQFEIERRGRQARAIQQSASPGYAQAAGQVLTALDNVQDLVTTVATVGRLTINPAIRVLDAIGPQPTATAISNQFARTELARLVARRAAGEAITAGVQAEALFVARRAGVAAFQTGAYKLGTFALGRAVPVLGWVLLAADLMKLVTQIGMLAFPAYALACAGPRAGLAAGLPALLMGPTLCKPIGAWSKINPFGRKSKLARSRLARSWRPTVPNLIEVAQTTDSLFGVGISLGALTGLVSDTAFGIEQQNRGKDVRINATGAADSMHRIFSGQLARESGAALHDLRRGRAGVRADAARGAGRVHRRGAYRLAHRHDLRHVDPPAVPHGARDGRGREPGARARVGAARVPRGHRARGHGGRGRPVASGAPLADARRTPDHQGRRPAHVRRRRRPCRAGRPATADPRRRGQHVHRRGGESDHRA